MAKKKKQVWGIGDYFTVPLADGTFSIGQVVGQEPEALNSVTCAFFARRLDSATVRLVDHLVERDLISVLFVTRDLLDSGDWQIIFSADPFPTATYFDVAALRAKGFVGVKVIGSGIVIKLMDAYYGLYPWNGFNEPDYLDRLLVSADRKPSHVVLK